jgi:CRISPR-associated exonuclease Cas4
MRAVTIPRAALWYWQTRRREWVELDTALRQQTEAIIAAVRAQFDSGQTPRAAPGPRCRACSLRDLCQPELAAEDRSAAYVKGLFKP